MAKFGLRHVYITNAVKCSLTGASDPERCFVRLDITRNPFRTEKLAIARRCAARWLNEELMIVQPRAVFCFGNTTRAIAEKLGIVNRVHMIHPNAYHKPFAELVARNDSCMDQTLRSLEQ
jgi:uracil-DNA glycosylase